MKERVSKLTCIPHAPTLLENAVYNEWQFQAFKWRAIRQKTSFIWVAKIILAKVQKGYKLLLKNIESAFPINMHIFTICPLLLQSFRKYCWVVSEELRWQTVFSWIFHFGQISKFKKAVIPRKKIESKSTADMNMIYTICPSLPQSFRKICWAVSEELRLRTVSVVSYILAKFLSLKRALLQEKKLTHILMWLRAPTHTHRHSSEASGEY